MLYVFLLTVYTETSTDVYVEDSGLTGADCIAAMESYNEANPSWTMGNPSCEPDHAALPAVFLHDGKEITLPACEYEDSNNCYWAAEFRGNGLGESFYVIDGKAYAFKP